MIASNQLPEEFVVDVVAREAWKTRFATGDRTDGVALPLAGLRILELGHFVAAPFATRLLADLGAEVIKVEPPGGDPVRQWGASVDGHTPWWSVHARNKYCITVNLKAAGARDLILDLVQRCDALIENFRPGQLARLGLDEPALRGARPDLVIARISGFGQDGPYRDYAAFGVIGEAMGGLRYLTDHPTGISDLPPVRVGVSLGDSIAGIYAALGVLAALWQRDSSRSDDGGAAKTVDVALTEAVFSLLEGALPEYGTLGSIRRPAGGRIGTAAPTNAYRSRDGAWILIAANSDPLFERLALAMGRPDLARTPRFAGNQARVQNVDELDAIIGAWTAGLDARELEASLKAADIPATRVYTIADCAADAQFRHRGMVREIADPLLGRTMHPGAVPRMEGEEELIRWPGPAIGAHNEEVLCGLLGYPPDRLRTLKERGVI